MTLRSLPGMRRLGVPAFALASALCASSATAGIVLGFDSLNVYGDSLSDTGRFASIDLADPANPLLTETPYNPASQRFTNETVWVERLQATNPGTTVRSVATGGAFAGRYDVGGATVDNAADLTGGIGPNDQFQGISEQIGLLDTEADTRSVLWIGNNDIVFIGAPTIGGAAQAAGAAAAAAGGTPDEIAAASGAAAAAATAEFVESLATSIVTAALAIDGLGGEQTYVVSIPDIGLTPLGNSRDAATQQLFSQITGATNAAVASALATTDVEVIDINSVFIDLLANPAQIGLNETAVPCVTGEGDGVSVCSNPNERLFWDDLHPSAPVHNLIGEVVGDAISAPVVLPDPPVVTPVPTPTTAWLVLLGLAIAARRALSRQR